MEELAPPTDRQLLYIEAGIRQAGAKYGWTFKRQHIDELKAEVMARFWEKGYSKDFPLKRMGYNLAVDFLRSKNRESGEIEDFPNLPFIRNEDPDHSETIEFFLRSASKVHRRIFELILHGVEPTSKALSAATGLSEHTVRQYLSDARSLLDDILYNQLHNEIAANFTHYRHGNLLSWESMHLPTSRRRLMAVHTAFAASLIVFNHYISVLDGNSDDSALRNAFQCGEFALSRLFHQQIPPPSELTQDLLDPDAGVQICKFRLCIACYMGWSVPGKYGRIASDVMHNYRELILYARLSGSADSLQEMKSARETLLLVYSDSTLRECEQQALAFEW